VLPIDLSGGILNRITNLMVSAIGAVVRFVTSFLFDEALSPNLAWMLRPEGPYAKALTVGLLLTVIAVAFAVVQSVVKGQGVIALKAISFDLGVAMLGMVFGVTVVQQLIYISDEISAYFLDGTEVRIEAFLAWVSDSTANFASEAGFFVVILTGVLTILAGAMLAIVLFSREFLIYLLVALLPFYFSMAVWPALRGAVRLGVQITVGLIFSKVAIAMALMVGTNLLANMLSAPLPSDGWVPGQFGFLPQGSMTYQGNQLVSLNDRPVRVPAWLRGTVFDEAMRQSYLSCVINPLVRVRGETLAFVNSEDNPPSWAELYAYEEQCAEPGDWTIGSRVDPDAEKFNRYVVPLTKDRAILRVLPQETELSGEAGSRIILLNEDFRTWDLFDSLNQESVDDPAEEITPEMAETLNPRFQNALNEALGYDSAGQALPGRGCDMYVREPATGLSLWDLLFGGAADRQDAALRDCAEITTDGTVLVNRVAIGQLEDNSVDGVDLSAILAGAALMLMAAFAPFVLVRLLPIVEAAVLIEGASAAARSPLTRAASFANPVNNIRALAGGGGGPSPGPTTGGPSPGTSATPSHPASSGVGPGTALARKG